METGSIFREFLKYVSLNILGQIAYSCYTLADTFFVSASLGVNGLAALNLAFPVFCFINGTGLMIGIGGGTKYAIWRGRKDHGRANQTFTNSLCLVIFFSVFFVLLGIFFSTSIVRLLGADDAVFSMTKTYLQVLLLFAPAFLANNLLQCFVRNDGSPALSMASMITGNLSNVVLDYIFIFPLHMGILGAILATSLAPVISIAVLLPYFIKKKNHFHVATSMPDRKTTSGILSSGTPSLVTEASSGIVIIVFNLIILRLEGNVGVAAYSVITVVSLVAVAIYTGLAQGIQPVMSRSHGMKRASDVASILKYALITMLLLSCAIYGIIFFCSPSIASVFNSERNEDLQQIAVLGLKLYFIACPFIGFNIVNAMYLTSTERPHPAQIISLLRGFFLIIPMAWLLSTLFGMVGVWCAFPVTELIVAIVGMALCIGLRHTYDTLPQRAES